MALLDAPKTPELTEAQKLQRRRAEVAQKAAMLLNTPRVQFEQLVHTLNASISAIWEDQNPQDILSALGTHGAELFGLSSAAVEFIEKLKPGATKDIVAKIRPTTIHEDGSVTVDSPFKPLSQSPDAPPAPAQPVEQKLESPAPQP